MISERARRNAGIKELDIFDYFQIDRNLPKYQKREEEKSLNGITVVGGTSTSTNSDMNPDDFGWGVPVQGNIGDFEGSKRGRLRIRERLGNAILGKKKLKQPKRVMSTLEMFLTLSRSYKELTKIGEIAEHYDAALKQARALGQKALVEKLTDLVHVVTGESVLIAMGLTKYVTEEQVVDFYEKVGEDKNLKLTWIKNFSRIIPEDIYEVKKDVDDRMIFDNYVILHYDPENNGQELTKKELEAKKDPILFGLIKNSKKLYYIADWKDEYCDLTLEDMFNTLGEKVLKINNKSVKTFISKVK